MQRSFYFSSNNDVRFQCLCGLFHVRTATFILALVQILFLCYSAVSVPLAYAHITRNTWNLITISFFIISFVSGVIAAITLLGLVGEHPKLLIPQILWLIVCGSLSCVLATVAVIAVTEGGWLSQELFGSQKWIIDWNDVNFGLKITVCVLLVIMLNALIVIISVWLVKIVVQCLRYIRLKMDFELRMLSDWNNGDEQVPINAAVPHY